MPARESHHDHGGLATIYHDHNSPCDLHWYFQWKEQESENNEASPVFHTEGEGGQWDSPPAQVRVPPHVVHLHAAFVILYVASILMDME